MKCPICFPFCSSKLIKKKWPYYSILITQLKSKYYKKYDIVVAPGPKEIYEAKLLNAHIILDQGNALKIDQLISLIKDASFIVANDTGPAHIASHLKKKGLVLFGSHTSAEKVSIGNSNFKVLSVKELTNLDIDTVIKEIKNNLN